MSRSLLIEEEKGMSKIVRALISVSNKHGVVELAQELVALGVEILSTGGTAKALEEAGINVVRIEEHTGFPEMLDGRLKTLHPKIHGGILGQRDNPTHQQQMSLHNLPTIDLVAVNLYPFEQTVAKPECLLAEAIENIDIGGPTLIRAAAKNYRDVAVIIDPADYPSILAEMWAHDGSLSLASKFALAKKAFQLTARYDGAIADYLGGVDEGQRKPFNDTLHLQFFKAQDLRYGENPHQAGVFYREREINEPSIASARQLQGKELSFNNIVDANAALELLKEFVGEIAAVAIKHTNPCGVATSTISTADAFRKAWACDPVSIFGGIVGFNREVDEETAQEILRLYQQGFLEIVIAPAFSARAQEMLVSSKRLQNIRLLEVSMPEQPPLSQHEIKQVVGGLLLQERDLGQVKVADCQVVTRRQPVPAEYQALDFGWKVCKHVKSNAIVFAREDQVIGVGAGQMSRVDAAKVAIMRARDLGLDTQGTVVASDAFFPFRDGVDVAARAGAKAIIQPGGSLRDQEVIEAANEHGLAMVFTQMRHFRH